MSQVYVVVPGSDKPNFSGTALSAFAQALEERKCYALVRYVSRIDSPPKMGVLIPYIERGDKNEVRLAVLHFVQVSRTKSTEHFYRYLRFAYIAAICRRYSCIHV